MNYSEIKELCKKGKVGIVPNWKGYIKWDYSRNQIIFVNGDYIMYQDELSEKIGNKTDLYYII